MKVGFILVKGNVGEGLGFNMHGGTIVVEGNALVEIGSGNQIGEYMTGGKIEIYGKIGSISPEFKGGEIYHRGKRIR